MSDRDIQEVELNIDEAKKFVALAEAVVKLQSNRQFKSVVMEGYFEKEAVRLVHLKADPRMQSPDRQLMIDHDIRAIGAFHQYLQNVQARGEMAANAIAEDEATLEELRDEGATH